MRNFVFIVLLSLPTLLAAADSDGAGELPALLGSWEGSMVIGQDSTNLAFTFSENNGEFQAALISTAMGIYGMPAETIEFNGTRIVISLPRIDGVFTGRIRLDDSGDSIARIDGDWFQYAEMIPITLLPVDNPSF